MLSRTNAGATSQGSRTLGRWHSARIEESPQTMDEAEILRIGRNLEHAGDGVLAAHTASRVSYPETGHDVCYSLEDRSFWFRHRNDCIVLALKAFPPGGTLFDVGAGNGFVARGIRDESFDVVALEAGAQGVRNARARELRPVIWGAIQDCGFEPSTIPSVGLFDVLEHIEERASFLAHIRHVLVDGGRLYLTVPAYQALWSYEDEDAGHFRRYTLATLRRELDEAGFVLEYGTYIFSFLPLPILLLRTLPYRLGIRGSTGTETAGRDHASASGAAGAVLERFLRFEREAVTARRAVPFGGSCLAVARVRK
jgi:SAM-dependent methyltransferase